MAFELHPASRIFAAAIALSSAFIACSGNSTGDAAFAFNGDCTTVKTVPTFTDLQQGILPICLGCHSMNVMGAARHMAPDGVNFDTYEEFSALADEAVTLVKAHQMPAPDGVGPTDSERNQLYAWAACGKPR